MVTKIDAAPEMPALRPTSPAALQARLEAVERQLHLMTERLETLSAATLSRLDALAMSRATPLGDYTALTFLRTGQRIFVDTRSLDIGVHLLTLGEWQGECMALVSQLVQPGQVVIDIGANHGVFTLLGAAATGPAGRVFAYEPNPRLAELARLSAQLNGYGGFTTVTELALGEMAGEVNLAFDPRWSGGGHADWDNRGDAPHMLTVAAAPLDRVLPDDICADFIKLSAEGSEGLVLRGMQEVLDRSPHARLLMDFAPELLARNGTPAEEVVAELEGRGLVPYLVEGGGELVPADMDELLATPGLHRKILFEAE